VKAYLASMRLAPLILLAFVAPLGAQPADVPLASAQMSRDAEALFRRLDTNGDGVLSPQELAAPGAADGSWIAVDRNRDGRITREEFGVVRNFASTQPSSAAGGSRETPQKPAAATGAGRP